MASGGDIYGWSSGESSSEETRSKGPQQKIQLQDVKHKSMNTKLGKKDAASEKIKKTDKVKGSSSLRIQSRDNVDKYPVKRSSSWEPEKTTDTGNNYIPITDRDENGCKEINKGPPIPSEEAGSTHQQTFKNNLSNSDAKQSLRRAQEPKNKNTSLSNPISELQKSTSEDNVITTQPGKIAQTTTNVNSLQNVDSGKLTKAQTVKTGGQTQKDKHSAKLSENSLKESTEQKVETKPSAAEQEDTSLQETITHDNDTTTHVSTTTTNTAETTTTTTTTTTTVKYIGGKEVTGDGQKQQSEKDSYVTDKVKQQKNEKPCNKDTTDSSEAQNSTTLFSKSVQGNSKQQLKSMEELGSYKNLKSCNKCENKLKSECAHMEEPQEQPVIKTIKMELTLGRKIILCSTKEDYSWLCKIPCLEINKGQLNNPLGMKMQDGTVDSAQFRQNLMKKLEKFFKRAGEKNKIALLADFSCYITKDKHSFLNIMEIYKILCFCYINTYRTPNIIYLMFPEVQKLHDELVKVEELSNEIKRLICDFSNDSTNHFRILMKTEEIARLECDAVVNTTSKDLKLSEGAVSSSLLNVAGKKMQYDLDYRYSEGISLEDEIAVTIGYKLPCQYVFHGALKTFDQTKNTKGVELMMKNCLLNGTFLNIASIAFPAIGTGKLLYPPADVAKSMYQAVKEFMQSVPDSSIKNIYFVIHPKAEEVLQVFKNEEAKHNERLQNFKRQLPNVTSNKETVTSVKKTVPVGTQDNEPNKNKRHDRFKQKYILKPKDDNSLDKTIKEIKEGETNSTIVYPFLEKDQALVIVNDHASFENYCQKNIKTIEKTKVNENIPNTKAKVRTIYQTSLANIKDLYGKSGAQIVHIDGDMYVEGNSMEIEMAFQVLSNSLKNRLHAEHMDFKRGKEETKTNSQEKVGRQKTNIFSQFQTEEGMHVIISHGTLRDVQTDGILCPITLKSKSKNKTLSLHTKNGCVQKFLNTEKIDIVWKKKAYLSELKEKSFPFVFVINAKFSRSKANEKTEDRCRVLTNVISECLKIADRTKCKSVTVPWPITGEHDLDVLLGNEACYRGLVEFSNSEHRRNITDLHFMTENPIQSEDAYKKLQSFFNTKTIDKNRHQGQIIYRPIMQKQSDLFQMDQRLIIEISFDTDLKGIVGSAYVFYKSKTNCYSFTKSCSYAAGFESFVQENDLVFENWKKENDFEIGSTKLSLGPVGPLLVVIVPDEILPKQIMDDHCIQQFKKCITNVLECANSSNIKYLALPFIAADCGSEVEQSSLSRLVAIYCECFKEFANKQNVSNLKQVNLFLCKNDQCVYNEFKEVLQAHLWWSTLC